MKITKALALALVGVSLLAAPAEAGFGSGIGITFPAGRSSDSSTPAATYAAFSVGQVTQELTVREKSGRLALELKVTNNGDTPYTIDHRDGQVYDFAILDKNGKTIYQWSDTMAFTQALTSSSIAAHDAAVYTAEIDRKKYRELKDDAVLVTAWLVDTPYVISTKLPTKTAGSSTPVLIHGGIILGNGHGYYD